MSPTVISPGSADPLSLRERKKLRTRRALIDAALERFTAQGFDGTTLDELCAAVEISKRTFFRYFSSKEDVAMAPTQDLWNAFLEDLESREPTGRTLLEMLQDALLAALHRMPAEGWANRVSLSHRLVAKTPALGAHCLHFCDRTSRAVIGILRQRFVLAERDDVRLRLALDIVVAAFHCALEKWTSRPGAPTRDKLTRQVRDAFAAIPGSLTLTVTPGVKAERAPLSR